MTDLTEKVLGVGLVYDAFSLVVFRSLLQTGMILVVSVSINVSLNIVVALCTQ